MTTGPVAGLVLAAGSSRRMDAGFKLLLPYGDGVLVEAPVATARAAGLRPVVVVTGHRGADVRGALEARFDAGDDGLWIVENPRHPAGQATSLARGIRTLRTRTRVAAAVVLLGDEPGVAARDVRRAVDAWRRRAADADPRPVLRTRYRDRPGHPVLFPRDVFPELEALEGDEGARPWMEENAGRVEELRLEETAPVDVDTGEDYRRVGGEVGAAGRDGPDPVGPDEGEPEAG